MIRINLAPQAKRRRAGQAKKQVAISAGAGQVGVMLMFFGWIGVAGLCWWLLDVEQEKTIQLRADAAAKNAEAEKIRKMIDEEGLQARKDKVAQLRVAIEKLKAQRRSPVFVMYEFANILTTGRMPDVDEEEQRRIEAADPQSRLAPNWDATSVWITSMKEAGGSLAIEGGARDASDLAEFTRRVRASSRFGELSHPDYRRVCQTKTCFLTWRLNVEVARWD
jgi:Tfp pilus assembly protein PilN